MCGICTRNIYLWYYRYSVQLLVLNTRNIIHQITNNPDPTQYKQLGNHKLQELRTLYGMPCKIHARHTAREHPITTPKNVTRCSCGYRDTILQNRIDSRTEYCIFIVCHFSVGEYHYKLCSCSERSAVPNALMSTFGNWECRFASSSGWKG